MQIDLTFLAQAASQSAAETFYRQFFVSGGPIVWFILLPMSVLMVYLGIDLLVTTRRNRLLPAGVSTELATLAVRQGVNALAGKLTGRADLISQSLTAAVRQASSQDASIHKMRQSAAEALQESGLRLSRKAQWLQLIGTIAPMVGLFGTVYGMICAFNLLGRGTEGPRYELLADSISVALVTTFWGLLVAIPAQFLYSFLQSRIESLVSEAAIETDVLIGRLHEHRAGTAKDGLPKSITPERVDTGDSKPAPKAAGQDAPARGKDRRLQLIVQKPMMKRRSRA